MTYKKQEYTEEEKALFLMNNSKFNFWVDKELLKQFSKLCKAKGKKPSEAVIHYMEKVVAKHGDKE